MQKAFFEEDDEDKRPRKERAAEASASLRAAIDMSENGKLTKAMRLFQHAMALVDDDPEILIAYGEFLEKFEKNYLEADHMYARALAISPRNSRALVNRERTSPLVAEIDFQVLRRIDAKRDELVKLPDSNAALRRIKKEAYFQVNIKIFVNIHITVILWESATSSSVLRLCALLLYRKSP